MNKVPHCSDYSTDLSRPHNFHVTAAKRGLEDYILMVCAHCGRTYMLGTDEKWHELEIGDPRWDHALQASEIKQDAIDEEVFPF